MTTYIVLLRGINVGGKNLVAMADLREAALALGLADAKTLLQSGNLVARATATKSEELERRLEAMATERLGVTIDVMVRTAQQWHALIAANPYPELAASDPSHLVAMLLKTAPTAAALDDLRAAIVGRETVECIGTTLYVAYPAGIGTSKLTNTLIERRLATRGTARNWNTVVKIGEVAHGMG